MTALNPSRRIVLAVLAAAWTVSPLGAEAPDLAKETASALTEALNAPLQLQSSSAGQEDPLEQIGLTRELVLGFFRDPVTPGRVDMSRVQDFINRLSPEQKDLLQKALKDPQSVAQGMRNLVHETP